MTQHMCPWIADGHGSQLPLHHSPIEKPVEVGGCDPRMPTCIACTQSRLQRTGPRLVTVSRKELIRDVTRQVESPERMEADADCRCKCDLGQNWANKGLSTLHAPKPTAHLGSCCYILRLQIQATTATIRKRNTAVSSSHWLGEPPQDSPTPLLRCSPARTSSSGGRASP